MLQKIKRKSKKIEAFFISIATVEFLFCLFQPEKLKEKDTKMDNEEEQESSIDTSINLISKPILSAQSSIDENIISLE